MLDPCEQIIVHSIVQIGCAVKAALRRFPDESVELAERLNITEKMLGECMACDSMAKRYNVVKMLESPFPKVKDAVMSPFIDGPLSDCIDYKLGFLLGSPQVYI